MQLCKGVCFKCVTILPGNRCLVEDSRQARVIYSRLWTVPGIPLDSLPQLFARCLWCAASSGRDLLSLTLAVTRNLSMRRVGWRKQTGVLSFYHFMTSMSRLALHEHQHISRRRDEKWKNTHIFMSPNQISLTLINLSFSLFLP